MDDRRFDPDCIFCRIAEGSIPSRKIHETDDLIAFHDVSPQAPVHALIIPKAHHRDLCDDVSDELIGTLFSAVPTVARMLGVDESGFRTVVNTGSDAGQTVFHVHIHIIGGAPMAERMVRLTSED